MTDRDSRLLDRRAAAGDPEAVAGLLRDRVRRGEVSMGRVQLAAYLGDEASRVVDGWLTGPDDPSPVFVHSRDPCIHAPVGKDLVCSYCAEDDEWAKGFIKITSPLGEREIVRACPELNNDPLRHVWIEGGTSLRCPLCKGTGWRTFKGSWVRYLSVVGALAVGRACLLEWEARPEESPEGGGRLLVPVRGARVEFGPAGPCHCRTSSAWGVDSYGICESCGGSGVASTDLRPRNALDAAQDWVDEPTEANASQTGVEPEAPVFPSWVIAPGVLTFALFPRPAAGVLFRCLRSGGRDARAIFGAALVPLVLGLIE